MKTVWHQPPVLKGISLLFKNTDEVGEDLLTAARESTIEFSTDGRSLTSKQLIVHL
jgi:hypothetical protein